MNTVVNFVSPLNAAVIVSSLATTGFSRRVNILGVSCFWSKDSTQLCWFLRIVYFWNFAMYFCSQLSFFNVFIWTYRPIDGGKLHAIRNHFTSWNLHRILSFKIASTLWFRSLNERVAGNSNVMASHSILKAVSTFIQKVAEHPLVRTVLLRYMRAVPLPRGSLGEGRGVCSVRGEVI